MAEELPMFPLGTVLFPRAVLPLHVFEPRYRALVDRCLGGDHEFGVVLIERGHEVGGGDARFDVGTAARILRAERLDDGRFVLVNVGTERLRVVEWLPDDPYPLARVARLTDRGGRAEQVNAVRVLLRRLLALQTELGAPVPTLDVHLDDDPVRASFEACAVAGLGPLDAQQLLELDDAGERLVRLEGVLADTCAVLELRLGGG